MLSSWLFTSEPKNSKGHFADGTEIHPEAIYFEAQMTAGISRMMYWPHEEGGHNRAIESKTKTGWKRFTLHHYKTNR